MNKKKHTDVHFCTREKASKLINDPRFVSLDEFNDDCYEVIIPVLLMFDLKITIKFFFKLDSVLVYKKKIKKRHV